MWPRKRLVRQSSLLTLNYSTSCNNLCNKLKSSHFKLILKKLLGLGKGMNKISRYLFLVRKSY